MQPKSTKTHLLIPMPMPIVEEVKYKTVYTIVSEFSTTDYLNKVNELLDAGWILYGNPYFVEKRMTFVQALTRTTRIN